MNVLKYGYIYLIINLINNMKYIGQRKFGQKEPYLGSGKHLKCAITKYGKENFSKKILMECDTKEELDYFEKFFIASYNAVESDEYYNISSGGEGFHGARSEENRQKMLGNKNALGSKRTKEDKDKISNALTGKPLSAKHKQNISNALMGKPKSKEHIKNVALSRLRKKEKQLNYLLEQLICLLESYMKNLKKLISISSIFFLTSCSANNIPNGTIGFPIGQILGAELPRKGTIDTRRWFDYGAGLLGGAIADSVEADLHPNTDDRYNVIRQNVLGTHP